MNIKELFESYIETLPADTTLKDICEYMKANGFKQNEYRYLQWELAIKPYAFIIVELQSDQFLLKDTKNLLNVSNIEIKVYVQLPYKVHVSESRVIPFSKDTWETDINNTFMELLNMNTFTSDFLINKAQDIQTADEYIAQLEQDNKELKAKLDEVEAELLDAIDRIDALEGELLDIQEGTYE